MNKYEWLQEQFPGHEIKYSEQLMSGSGFVDGVWTVFSEPWLWESYIVMVGKRTVYFPSDFHESDLKKVAWLHEARNTD